MQSSPSYQDLPYAGHPPINIEEVDDPATVLDILRILLDTERMEVLLPRDKFERIEATIIIQCY